ncbi:uncharacterized protein LOC114068098 [Empidonax traillii]|uniref:uncharacterized protein LOC114068098 n=1 Tax=Empidonax traillii TaxID=164674 RepID=UPI000FFDAA90|nr:uncharacterized protein LOC114068098 [Empidonax traillii]
MAQADTRLTKMKAKPDVGTAPTDLTSKSVHALNNHTRNSDTTRNDQRMKSDTDKTDDTTSTDTPSIDRMAISDAVLTDEATNSDAALPHLTAEVDTTTTTRRRLVIKGFGMLSKDPVMAKRMCSLSESLVQLLWDADVELVELALPIFLNMLQNKDILTSSPTALKLAEALRPLFDSDNSHVQILSIHLFQEVMKSVVDEGKKPLKIHVVQNLFPFFLYWHDENQQSGTGEDFLGSGVPVASQKALLRAAWFLKRKDLEQLLKTEQPLKFGECLLEKDKSQVAEYVHQALPYLESPQEPLQEAAIKFIGMAGRYLKGQKNELQLVMDALQGMTHDSTAIKHLALKNLKMLRSAERPRSSPRSSSLKTHSRMKGLGRLLGGAAARGLQRTDPGNPV